MTPLCRQSFSMAQAVPNVCVSWKVFLKLGVNWNRVCGAIQDLPWRYIWFADNPVKVLNVHLLLLVGLFVPTKVGPIQACFWPQAEGSSSVDQRSLSG